MSLDEFSLESTLSYDSDSTSINNSFLEAFTDPISLTNSQLGYFYEALVREGLLIPYAKMQGWEDLNKIRSAKDLEFDALFMIKEPILRSKLYESLVNHAKTLVYNNDQIVPEGDEKQYNCPNGKETVEDFVIPADSLLVFEMKMKIGQPGFQQITKYTRYQRLAEKLRIKCILIIMVNSGMTNFIWKSLNAENDNLMSEYSSTVSDEKLNPIKLKVPIIVIGDLYINYDLFHAKITGIVSKEPLDCYIELIRTKEDIKVLRKEFDEYKIESQKKIEQLELLVNQLLSTNANLSNEIENLKQNISNFQNLDN